MKLARAGPDDSVPYATPAGGCPSGRPQWVWTHHKPTRRAPGTAAGGQLRSSGRTLVIATHDLDLAAALSDRSIILSEDHQVIAHTATPRALADQQALTAANLT